MRGVLIIFAAMVAVIFSPAHAQQANSQQSNADCQPVKIQGGTVQFLVTKTRNGYRLLLPPDLLRKFPDRANYKISLTDKGRKKASITGGGIKSGSNFLDIRTRQTFKLASIERNDVAAIDISSGDSRPSTESNRCRGCERDPNLENYDTASEICFCDIKKEP